MSWLKMRTHASALLKTKALSFKMTSLLSASMKPIRPAKDLHRLDNVGDPWTALLHDNPARSLQYSTANSCGLAFQSLFWNYPPLHKMAPLDEDVESGICLWWKVVFFFFKNVTTGPWDEWMNALDLCTVFGYIEPGKADCGTYAGSAKKNHVGSLVLRKLPLSPS